METHFGRTPAIIEEPFEGPRGKPRSKPGRICKFVWYGHSHNLDTLVEGLGQLTRFKRLFKLNVVTNNVVLAKEILASAPRPEFLIECKISPFSLETQWRAVDSANVVLIPSMQTPIKAVKGHNRLVQSIHAGRLAVAFPLPQYKELGDYCVCSEDLAEGLAWALENRRAVFRKIKAGQQYIDSRFAPGVVANR